MGKNTKRIKDFIESIPEDKLTGFPDKGLVWETRDFRLDNQGMTSDKPPKYNLQIQVNYQTTITTLEKVAPDTVAGPVLATGDETAEDIRKALLDKVLL